MASESSSAVVELTDADSEHTECGSVTVTSLGHSNETAPLIMERGADIAVKVDAPMKQLSTLETFVTYRVRCVCARWPTPPHVRRRYNHFKVLHKRLSAAHPWIAVPPLPPLHSARQQLDRYSPAFVARRTIALHAFLDRVAKHPILTHSEDFRIFLTTADEEIDKVFKSENSALNLWGLSSALYSSGSDAKPTTNGARVKDPEFTWWSEYLTSLSSKLTGLSALSTKLHHGSAALGHEYMGMKRACDAWSSQAGGRCGRSAAAASHGAAQGSVAHSKRAPLRPRATLPLLAAYAEAHVDKIRQRDAIHAAHVAGNNTDELHNRLEQASEALRSDLSDWTPKTRSEIKSILLEIAERQVAIHTQTLLGWEHALRLTSDSVEMNFEDMFKTVSKTAVQNLSPSKYRPDNTPTETDRDFDDLENYSGDSDQDIIKFDDDDEIKAVKSEGNSSDVIGNTFSDVNRGVTSDSSDIKEVKDDSGVKSDVSNPIGDVSNLSSDPLNVLSVSKTSIHDNFDIKSDANLIIGEIHPNNEVINQKTDNFKPNDDVLNEQTDILHTNNEVNYQKTDKLKTNDGVMNLQSDKDYTNNGEISKNKNENDLMLKIKTDFDNINEDTEIFGSNNTNDLMNRDFEALMQDSDFFKQNGGGNKQDGRDSEGNVDKLDIDKKDNVDKISDPLRDFSDVDLSS